MLHRLLFTFTILSQLLLSMVISTSIYAAQNELVFLTWSEYIDPEIVQSFEEKYQAKIKLVYYETDDARDELLIQTDGKGYDLILSDGTSISRYKKQGWIQTLPIKEIPNLKFINKKWQNMFKDSYQYAVPYFWGTTGIAYRKDLIGREITSWKDLFQPTESLRGKIAMIRSSRDAIGMALKQLGFSVNSESREEIKLAEALLKAQKPYVRDYSYIVLDKTSALVKGDVHMAMAYSGDALVLQEHNENIEYVLPKEGGNIWIDYILVSNNSKNKKLAYRFLNFLNTPKIAKKNAEFVYYATPNKAAKKLLDKDFLNNTVIYPSTNALSKSEIYTPLRPRSNRFRNQIFSNIAE